MDPRRYDVRPSIGTHRVDLICKRCKGPVRDSQHGGVATLDSLTKAAESHERRMHRPDVEVIEVMAAQFAEPVARIEVPA